MTPPRLAVARHCCALVWLFCCAGLLGAQTARKSFDLPSAAAEQGLKKFSQQAGVQVLFAAEVTEGVRTNAVKGDFTPLEAANKLLAGTPLTVVHDERTGVISVARAPAETAPKNVARAAQSPSDRPENRDGREGASESVIELSPFTVDASRDSWDRVSP